MIFEELKNLHNINQVHFSKSVQENIKNGITNIKVGIEPNLSTLFFGCDNQNDRILIKKHKSNNKIILFFDHQILFNKNKCKKNRLFLESNSNIKSYILFSLNNIIYFEDIEKYFIKDIDFLIYYSNTDYQLLFQRPQQIMRFMSNTYNKIFIGKIDKVIYEERYNLLVVPYAFKDYVYDTISSNTITYYSDPRLFNEINRRKGKKLFDLIDAPIAEFKVWKPNLHKSVTNADYVIYSHPDLIRFLKEINETKEYHYISNACDYEHFSKAKERIGSRPSDFPQTDKPILGYYGSFAEWLDYDLIRKYADEGKYHIIMIGGIPENQNYNIRFNHSNITWLEHKPYEQLPYYLSWFDTCFLPFRDCELNKYVNPCKLWEYISSEKEIISLNINIDFSNLKMYKDECKKISFILQKSSYFIKDELNFEKNLNYLTNINSKNIIGVNSKKPTIIIFSIIDYYFRIQRHQHMSRILAENGYQVLYLKTNINNKKLEYNEISKNLYEISLEFDINRRINTYQNHLNNSEIEILKKSIKKLGKVFNFDFFISVIVNPFWYQVIKNISNTAIIFDSCDYTPGFNNIAKELLDNEKELLNSNEHIMFTSNILKSLHNYNKVNFEIIRNGCDFEYFNNISKNKNEKKVVGYYGAISDWFNVDLLEYVIINLPDVDFHLIGSTNCLNQNHENKIKNLKKTYKNVKIFGEIPYKDLYKYISHFDVGLIPFIINDLIKCTNPVKLYEMSSFGLPIVLTELPDVLDLNQDKLYYISKTKEDFLENVKIALNEKNKELVNNRIEFSKNNTWESRVVNIEKIINKIAPGISIVLLCWNHWEETKKCIESVINNTNYYKYELIVVNNNSSDNTKEGLEYYSKNYDFIKVINNYENFGFAIGMNIGALNSQYDYIVLMNNDTMASNDWLYPLIKPLILKNYGCGSPITNNCGNEVKQFIYFNNIQDLMEKASNLQKREKYAYKDIDRIPFFCPVVRKKDFYSVGMLDKNYGLGGWEDDDFLHKLKLYNGNQNNFYTYGSFIYHMESLTMKDINTKGKGWTQANKNQTIFENKWNTKWVPPKYYMPKISVKITSKNEYLSNIIRSAKYQNENIFIIDNNNYKLEISDIDNENTLIVLNEMNDIINLKYNNYNFKINKKEWNIFNIYAIINSCI